MNLFPLTTLFFFSLSGVDFLFLWDSTTLGRICVKLVIVMGITWIADVISWAHGVWFGSTHILWIITDLINALQGVFIFIVIGCQPQVNIPLVFGLSLAFAMQTRISFSCKTFWFCVCVLDGGTHFVFTVYS